MGPIYTFGQSFVNVTTLNSILLDECFDRSTDELHYFFILSMVTKYQDDNRLITITSIKCLNIANEL